MKPVTVGRYCPQDLEGMELGSEFYAVEGAKPVAKAGDEQPYFKGYVSTEDWIIFEAHDGVLWVYHGRDPETGAVTGKPMIVKPGDHN